MASQLDEDASELLEEAQANLSRAFTIAVNRSDHALVRRLAPLIDGFKNLSAPQKDDGRQGCRVPAGRDVADWYLNN